MTTSARQQDSKQAEGGANKVESDWRQKEAKQESKKEGSDKKAENGRDQAPRFCVLFREELQE